MDYFVNYALANVFCTLIFAIMLIHDVISIDRQEKQLKYDRALIAFILYFLSDTLWAAFDSQVLTESAFSAALTNFLNFVFMACITFTWLEYVMVVEQVENREKRAYKIATLSPFIISTLALVIIYIVAPGVLFDGNFKATPVFNIFLIGTPNIYRVAIIIYAMRRVAVEENPIEKRKHYYICFYPVLVVGGGLIQAIWFPTLPIFCCGCAILMFHFYVQSMEKQISTDPLTRLNNRGQLMRYVSQKSNLRMEGRSTYVVIVDVNDFKSINDNYGHAEGDSALEITAKGLTDAVSKHNLPIFLCRYGGDEFVMVVHPSTDIELEGLIKDVRESVFASCSGENKPYGISVGIGYDQLLGGQDTFVKCLQRADRKLYLDKEYQKINGRTTVCN
ncbi:MAG: diguanylate cyclase [Clostridia bacterium]|nr:diguanylate cyclase [Clostridia bacterium]